MVVGPVRQREGVGHVAQPIAEGVGAVAGLALAHERVVDVSAGVEVEGGDGEAAGCASLVGGEGDREEVEVVATGGETELWEAGCQLSVMRLVKCETHLACLPLEHPVGPKAQGGASFSESAFLGQSTPADSAYA